MTYQLTSFNTVVDEATGLAIPLDQANADYQAYIAWVTAGGVPTPVPTPSQASVANAMEQVIQGALDATAQSRGYDNINAIAKYVSVAPVIPSTDQNFAIAEKFRLECNAMQVFMYKTWAASYAYQATILAGKNPMPTAAEVVAMITPIVWPN